MRVLVTPGVDAPARVLWRQVRGAGAAGYHPHLCDGQERPGRRHDQHRTAPPTTCTKGDIHTDLGTTHIAERTRLLRPPMLAPSEYGLSVWAGGVAVCVSLSLSLCACVVAWGIGESGVGLASDDTLRHDHEQSDGRLFHAQHDQRLWPPRLPQQLYPYAHPPTHVKRQTDRQIDGQAQAAKGGMRHTHRHMCTQYIGHPERRTCLRLRAAHGAC
jgi:hypothetical protein